ncbi:hypothetical protein GC169_02175 [bacterium]|nr:hypothetical protein [bacterium]
MTDEPDGESLRDAVAAAERKLVDLLAERWRLLERELAEPGFNSGFDPARDAATARRVVESAAGRLPAGVAVRIWRALSAETQPLRGVVSVLTCGGDLGILNEAARGYFGFACDVSPVAEIREALERAELGKGEIACLPWPELAGAGQWWPMLNENRFRNLAILDGWPRWNGSGAPRAAIVYRGAPQPSGDDDTLATAHDDRHAAEQHLAEAGLVGQVTARARSLVLLRLREYVAPDDPRLDAARRAGLDGLRVVGVLPRP